MKKLILILVAVCGVSLFAAAPKAQAGVYVGIGLPGYVGYGYPYGYPYYGPAYYGYPGGYYGYYGPRYYYGGRYYRRGYYGRGYGRGGRYYGNRVYHGRRVAYRR